MPGRRLLRTSACRAERKMNERIDTVAKNQGSNAARLDDETETKQSGHQQTELDETQKGLEKNTKTIKSNSNELRKNQEQQFCTLSRLMTEMATAMSTKIDTSSKIQQTSRNNQSNAVTPKSQDETDATMQQEDHSTRHFDNNREAVNASPNQHTTTTTTTMTPQNEGVANRRLNRNFRALDVERNLK